MLQRVSVCRGVSRTGERRRGRKRPRNKEEECHASTYMCVYTSIQAETCPRLDCADFFFNKKKAEKNARSDTCVYVYRGRRGFEKKTRPGSTLECSRLEIGRLVVRSPPRSCVCHEVIVVLDGSRPRVCERKTENSNPNRIRAAYTLNQGYSTTYCNKNNHHQSTTTDITRYRLISLLQNTSELQHENCLKSCTTWSYYCFRLAFVKETFTFYHTCGWPQCIFSILGRSITFGNHLLRFARTNFNEFALVPAQEGVYAQDTCCITSCIFARSVSFQLQMET